MPMTFQQIADLANNVVAALGRHGVLPLHVGSLAFLPWRPPGGLYAFDDLQLLVKDTDLPAVHTAMSQHYRLVTWDRAARRPVPAPPGAIGQASPRSPAWAYSDLAPPDPLWIQFHTTWRHGPLLLVNLDHWFDPGMRDPIPVVPPLGPADRPLPWALLLWQASMVTICASDCALSLPGELDKLRALATDVLANPGATNQVAARAPAYDQEYLCRLNRFSDPILDYANGQGINPALLIAPPGAVGAADLDYGVLYDLRHAMDALAHRYGVGLPAAVIAAIGTGTGVRPRKIWDDTGRLGTAGFSVHHQLTTYPGLSASALLNAGHAHTAAAGLPLRGYWSLCTPADLARIMS